METNKKFRESIDSMHNLASKLNMEHARPSKFGTDIFLHRVEIHTVQTIGENEGINLMGLADLIKVTKGEVTKGAMSQTISKLHGKK